MEDEIKAIIAELKNKGFVVRREPLKRGLGWKAESGCCRANDERILFVDRRSPLSEQLSFLRAEKARLL
jgi:hypothetical protein